MCGRYSLEINERFEQRFNAVGVRQKLQSNYNIFPGQEQPIIVNDKFQIMKWGLVPYWSKDGKDQIINIRSETAVQKFRKLVKYNRCLIPATGFFEWQKIGGNKIPYYFYLKSNNYFTFAGVYENNTYSILTTNPNEVVSSIHNRMPVILSPENEKDWLDIGNFKINRLLSLFKPYQSQLMGVYRVSYQVNNPFNKTREVIDPIKVN